MKVIYKKSVLLQIDDAVQYAHSLQKEIEHIELTNTEWNKLKLELQLPIDADIKNLYVADGMKIKVVEEKLCGDKADANASSTKKSIYDFLNIL